jgi:hypothetical protein
VCNVESRCSVHWICRRRSSPCGNRSCGRSAQQENEFSPLQFLELHLLAMVSQWGVCNHLAILASSFIPLTPRRLRVRHSGAFCINGIAQRPSLDANTGKSSGEDRSVYRLSPRRRRLQKPERPPGFPATSVPAAVPRWRAILVATSFTHRNMVATTVQERTGSTANSPLRQILHRPRFVESLGVPGRAALGAVASANTVSWPPSEV